METLGYLMARHALNDHLERPNKCSIKDSVMKQLVAILHAYRVNCAVSSGSGQLILPDSLKALPLYISGFLKQASIRARTASNSCASPGNGDELCVQFRSIQKLNVRHASFAFLTRIVSIYPSVQAEFVAASRNKIYPSRMYLIDLDDHIIFYVGREVDPKLVSLLFGPGVVEKLSDMRKSPVMDVQPRLNENEWTVNVRSLIESLTWGRPPVQYKCILGSSTVGETKLSNMLYEDRIGNESGYIDWLCNIHRIIQEKIDT
jgi:protein transport protein SEC24